MELQERVKELLNFLNSGLYGREEAIRLALLSVVSGESLFLLGPPGTAKSMIARRLKSIFKTEKNTKYFEYLLNEFSTPDEIFGPVSLKALEEDKYQRKTEGFLPEADIAFLDEIWKAGPAILNTLLTIVNERKFHNGSEVKKCPLKSLVAASNELPAKNKGLEALWDRFVFRVLVDPIDNEEEFFKMIKKGQNSEKEFTTKSEALQEALISVEELKLIQNNIDKIEIPEQIENFISAIRKDLQLKNEEENREDDEKYYISDRRWKKIVHILRTSAYLNGRKEVDILDASIIENCIWSTQKQREEVKTTLEKLIKEENLEVKTSINDIAKQINNFKDKINKTWYKEEIIKAKPAAPIIHNIQGKDCYKYTLRPNKNRDIYIEVKPYDSYYKDRYYAYIKDNNSYEERRIFRVKFSKDKRTVTIDTEKFNLEWSKATKKGIKYIKDESIFNNPNKYATIKEKFDNQEYKPIYYNIKQEILYTKRYKAEMEAQFRSNQFIDQRYTDIILSNIDLAIEELENAKIELNKEKNRYEK